MQDDRALASVSRAPRLPVWPVLGGVSCWAAELVGLTGLSRAMERRWGGRVTPMSLSGSDPFLMLVHHRHSFSRLDPLRPLSALVVPEGFPAHPHRGFETVTMVLEGGMRHRDSAGVKMVYRAGSVQWLTAGRGVLHEEMWAHEAGPHHELYQIWVNLPRAHKFDEPAIQLLGPADVEEGPGVMRAPLPATEVDGVELTVLAGACHGLRSPVRTQSPMTLMRLVWATPGEFAWDELPSHHTALFYVRSGAVEVGGRRVSAGELGQFERSGKMTLRFTAVEPDTDLLVLTGAPIGEPVAMRGSMVMSTAAEIERAYADLDAGLFGRSWPHTATDAEWKASLGSADRHRP